MTRRDVETATRFLKRRDPQLGAWITRTGPVALRRHSHHFGALCRSIVSQQLSAKAATTIHNRFLELVGSPRHPDPAAVLRLSPDELRSCGLSRRKSEYVLALARAFDRGGDLAGVRLGALSNAEVVERLICLPGVGAWTAEMFLIFALGRRDVFSAGDLALRAAIDRVEGRSIPMDEVASVAERWSPWRSVACLYLWKIAHWDNGERADQG